jgi:hypothetical protein
MNARFGYAAALQDFSPAYVGSGSNSTEPPGTPSL